MHINEILSPLLDVSKADDLSTKSKNNKKLSINSVIQEGQMVLAQIKTDSIKTKRMRLTMKIALAGRYLVYVPQSTGTGVSRRIENEEERQRLKTEIGQLKVKGGVIIRTQAQGKTDFHEDLQNLYKQWKKIKQHHRKTPGLVQQELSLEMKILRDEWDPALYHQVYIDDKEVYKKIAEFSKNYIPQLVSQLVYYDKKPPLFEKFGVEKQCSQVLDRKINLKSGGSIIIDENEAMVNIDVNTGRFVGKKSQKDTIFKTNSEAVKETARQLRLRNCGGMIIIDLIDMESQEDKDKILKILEVELKKDPVYTEIVSLSPLNLIQMTRKRTRESIKNTLCNECPVCSGRGAVLSAYNTACKIFRELELFYNDLLGRQKDKFSFFKKAPAREVQIECSAEVIDWIHSFGQSSLEFFRKKYGIQLVFKEKPLQDDFQIVDSE